MRETLNYLYDYKTLDRNEAREILTRIAGGGYTESEIASFITVFQMRSVTVDELSGFRDALLNLCIKTDLSDFEIIDVCGTGGDGKNTFNISTLTAFVLAGAGYKVAKHGNYGVTSSCGSSNIMEHLGYKFSTGRDKLLSEIETAGICFLHAPLFNPGMKNIAPVRKALKLKTFFNMLGPMVNPADPKIQLIGVYSLDLARLYNYIYQQTDKHYAIVHSLDGYDEISLTSDFRMILNGAEETLSPENLGFEKVLPQALNGCSTVHEASEIFLDILRGKGTRARNNVVIANSMTALKCYFPEKNFEECREIAERSLFGGKALIALNSLIEMQK